MFSLFQQWFWKDFSLSLTISPKWPAIFTIWTGKVFKSHLNMNLNKQRITSICVGGGKSKLIFAMCAKRSAGLAAECVAAWQISRLGWPGAPTPAAASNLNTWNASRDHPSPLQVKVGKHLLSSAPRLLLSNRFEINVYNDSESMGLFKHFRETLETNN